jgi:branched-chain amino acid transport system permease protein
VPLAGGLGGLVFGAAFGYVATKQRSTAFAMITMGLGELVAACALMFMGFFGGEGGISTDRMTGLSLLGVDYSSSWQVYCLIVAWTAIATLLMRLQTRTPLGRMANAQRDNFERTQFVGYDPRMIRFYQFTLSGFFAGIGGALYVLVYEIVTFDTVAAAKSATALLATYIGGVGSFLGPFIGTIVVVLLQSGVSLISNAWLLYVGVLFIVMVMFAPGGIMGIVARHEPIARMGRLGELAVPYARILAPGVLLVVGFVILVELAQLTTIGAAQNKSLTIGGYAVDPHSATPWVIGIVALVGGGLWLRREARFFRARWDALIEDAKARGLPV